MVSWKDFCEKNAQLIMPPIYKPEVYQQGAQNIEKGLKKVVGGTARALTSGVGAFTGYMEGARQANDRPPINLQNPSDMWNYFKDSWSRAGSGGKVGGRVGWEAAPAVYSGMAEGAKESIPGLLDGVGAGNAARKVQSAIGFNGLMDSISSWQDFDDASRLSELGEEDFGNDSSPKWQDYLDSVEANNKIREGSRSAGELVPFAFGVTPFSLASKALTPLKYAKGMGGFVNAAQKIAPYADLGTMVAPGVVYAHGEAKNMGNAKDRIRKLYETGTEEQKRMIEREHPELVPRKSDTSSFPSTTRLRMGGL